ncbi:MAG: hypothetical protein B7Z51_03795, partial [Methyloversatilis sp. 12-65-5]
MKLAVRLAAAGAAGLLAVAGFAPLGLFPLPLLSLATLLWLTDRCAPRAAALTGFVFGLGWSLLIPRLPAAADAHDAKVGLSGVWHALRAHPLIMTVGFVGGFFESGLTSILPLYGLALGLGATAAALLVSASGLGSAI